MDLQHKGLRPTRRILRIVMTTAVLAGTALAITGAGAETSPAHPAHAARPAFDCVAIGNTAQHGNTISGTAGIIAPCSGGATVVIQRSRWYGWEDMATKNISGQGWINISYNCAGTGVHDFRTYINAQRADGSYEFHESNHINANCGG
ncbi:hypothetical protein ACFYZ9_18835 [Streptomyces sp. NPDC001691]|uniref:hypothetical protein n=1 Tax=Streptomyces sp. NPDC001691 TaxID=3364600 RepID=UPI0036C4DB6A